MKILYFIFYILCFPLLSFTTNAAECYKATIVKPSPFMGNNEEIAVLDDGTIWEIKYEYEYMYEYYPSVIACPNRGLLIVEGKKLNALQLK